MTTRTEQEINASLDGLEAGVEELADANAIGNIEKITAAVEQMQNTMVPEIVAEIKAQIKKVEVINDGLQKDVQPIVANMPALYDKTKLLQNEITKINIRLDAVTTYGVSKDDTAKFGDRVDETLTRP